MKNSDDTTGGRLKKAREEKGLSLEEVYRDIKIHPRILRVLEGDAIDAGIGEVYVKSFLRKYSEFLGFTAKDIILEPDSAPEKASGPRQEIAITANGKKSIPPLIKDRFTGSVFPLVSVIAILFTLSMVVFAGLKLIDEFKRFGAAFTGPPSQAPQTLEEAKAEADSSLLVPVNETLALKMQTRDDVWLRVKADGKVVFEHTLPKGSEESWYAEDGIEIWTGRAQALDFTLNDKRLGSPGRGLIKEIVIDRTGMWIRKK